MISKVYNEFVKYIVTYFRYYGFKIQTQYNSDIDIIKQYISSYNYRSLYKDVSFFNEETMKNFNQESYILMLYKYSPLRKNPNKFNNMNINMFFNPEINIDKKLNNIKDDNVIKFIQGIREINKDSYSVRDMAYVDFDFSFEVITSSTEIINNLQFLYLFNFAQKNLSFNIEFRLEEGIEPIVFTYNVKFNEIEDIGHIDFQNYGNMQHLTFSSTVSGPVLSNFEKDIKPIKKINLVMDFLPRDDYDDKLLHS